MKPESPALRHFLDEVSAHLGKRKGKRDVLLELESAIMDRAEEDAGGKAGEEAIATAVEAIGSPAEVALAYTGEKYLIGPQMYRPFLIYTGIVFLIHLTMILVASVTNSEIEVFPVTVMRVARPHSFLNLLFVGTQAMLMDIGLMVVIFAGVSRTRHSVHLPSVAFRVKTGIRGSLGRAVLALLVMLILNFLRDDLFIVIVDDVLTAEERVQPMFTHSFAANLFLINVFLVLVIAKEVGYGFLGERRPLVAADGAIGFLGVGLMIYLLGEPAFISFPSSLNVYTDALPTLNQLMNKVSHLIMIVFAVAFAMEGAKRFVRLRQM